MISPSAHIRFGSVVTVHASRRQVDVVMMDDGRRIAGVEVLSGVAAAGGGSWDLPATQKPATEAQAGGLGAGSRLIAAISFTPEGMPVALGWCQPRGSEMVFSEDDREVRRHNASGTYTTIAPDGSYEVCTGSSYFRIGVGGHQNLAAVAAGGKWTNPAAAHTITMATAGFTLTVQPDGTTVLNAGAGTITMRNTSSMTFDTPLAHFTGQVTSAGDMVAAGVSLDQHTHPDAQGGFTGPPG